MEQEITKSLKLSKLKKNKKEKLEKNFFDIQIRGYDHYVFMNNDGRAALVIDNHWIKSHIKEAVSNFNEELDRIDELELKDFVTFGYPPNIA